MGSKDGYTRPARQIKPQFIGVWMPMHFTKCTQLQQHGSQLSDRLCSPARPHADSAVVDLAIKAITRRKRPSEVAPGTAFNDTFFSGGKSPFKGSSFPSGHAAGVFSVATVVACRYQHHRWAPWLAYGFATAISFSRVTTLAHFPSDVFLGAALGYTITRYQVLSPR